VQTEMLEAVSDVTGLNEQEGYRIGCGRLRRTGVLDCLYIIWQWPIRNWHCTQGRENILKSAGRPAKGGCGNDRKSRIMWQGADGLDTTAYGSNYQGKAGSQTGG
jgi:hypothetical protein